MCKKTHHLTREERYQIQALHESGMSQRAIARQLRRAHSTIGDELRRGRMPRTGRYSPKRAERAILRSRQASGCKRRKLQGALWKRVRRCLLKRWSPEQTAGRLALEGLKRVSHSTIYRRIWRERQPSLLRCLRHRGKRYKKRGTAKRHLIPNRTDISERPQIVEEKTRAGDWEADTIVGAKHCGSVITLVERKSAFSKLKAMPVKRAETCAQLMIEALEEAGQPVLTVTHDNGPEFCSHEQVSAKTGCDNYFAAPYHSWQRGLNEHTNGLIRQFLPKGMNLQNISQPYLQAIENNLNNRPRKRLNYKTPNEVFFNLTMDGLIR